MVIQTIELRRPETTEMRWAGAHKPSERRPSKKENRCPLKHRKRLLSMALQRPAQRRSIIGIEALDALDALERLDGLPKNTRAGIDRRMEALDRLDGLYGSDGSPKNTRAWSGTP
jgi:hypothetical protein